MVEVILNKTTKQLEDRQKLIRLADTSVYGWATVSEYEAHELAKDDEDDNKIMRAENRAGRKVKQKRAASATYNQSKKFKRDQSYHEGSTSGDFFRPQTTYFGANRSQSTRSGGCFICGSFNHWKANCPRRAPSTVSKLPAQ